MHICCRETEMMRDQTKQAALAKAKAESVSYSRFRSIKHLFVSVLKADEDHRYDAQYKTTDI